MVDLCSFSVSDFLIFILFLFFGCLGACGVPGPGTRSEPQLLPKPQLWQCWIFNLLCQAGDRTYIPALPRHCQFCWATAGTPIRFFSSEELRFCISHFILKKNFFFKHKSPPQMLVILDYFLKNYMYYKDLSVPVIF